MGEVREIRGSVVSSFARPTVSLTLVGLALVDRALLDPRYGHIFHPLPLTPHPLTLA